MERAGRSSATAALKKLSHTCAKARSHSKSESGRGWREAEKMRRKEGNKMMVLVDGWMANGPSGGFDGSMGMGCAAKRRGNRARPAVRSMSSDVRGLRKGSGCQVVGTCTLLDLIDAPFKRSSPCPRANTCAGVWVEHCVRFGLKPMAALGPELPPRLVGHSTTQCERGTTISVEAFVVLCKALCAPGRCQRVQEENTMQHHAAQYITMVDIWGRSVVIASVSDVAHMARYNS
jgi:hypothetical protein